MNVDRVMTDNPLTIDPHVSIAEARDTMKKEKIHRLPVIHKGKLVGIVTEKDLLYASPSPASSLDVYEVSYLLSKITVEKVMTRDLITIPADTPVEDAARIMSDNDIGGLLVVTDGILKGIITESDLFRLFIDLFAAREKGIRVTARIPEQRGELARIAEVIRDAGGDIVSFANVRGSDMTNAVMILKIQHLDETTIREILTPIVMQIEDVREI